jgi:hypothetical protein
MTLWSERDEPVLRWLLENPPEAGILHINAGSDEPHAELTNLTQAQVSRAVETLRDAGYVSGDEGKPSTGGGFTVTRIMVTGTGKQAVGLWPRFDALGEPSELAAILDALADNAPTEEEASNLHRAAAAVRRAAPSVVRGLAVTGFRAAALHFAGI